MRRQAKLAAWLPWLGVLIITLTAVYPLWGSPPYGDDIRLHLYRIPLLNALWQEGVIFARWQPTLNFGYGSPLFNFYPPLSAYALSGFYWLTGQNATIALNLLFAAALLLGAVGMFLLGRHLYGAGAGLLAAALFTWAPHLVFQTYARGSTSNALALAFFPWAAWALIRLGQRPSLPRLLLAAAFIAAVMLSHTAASLLFLGPLLLLGLTAVVSPNRPWQAVKPKLLALLAALALGLGLSAFSWLPALVDIQYTRYELEADKVNFQDNFADILRWPEATVATAHNPALPKSTGLAQIGLGLVSTGLALVSLWQRRRQGLPYSLADGLTAVAGLLGLVTLFLATAWAALLWQWLTPLQALQFPWRLLDVPVFLLALAAGRLLLPPLSTWRSAVAGLGLVVAFANMVPYLHPPRISLPARPTLADVTAVQQQFGIFGLTAWGEYSSAAVQTWPTAPPFAGADGMIPLSEKVLNAPEGLAAVAGDPWQATWQTDLEAPSGLTLAVHHFPGWQARIDGAPLPVQVDDNGRIHLTIPGGEHKVELAFRRTPLHWLADILTLLSLAIFIIGIIASWRRRDGRQPETTPPPPDPSWLLPVLVCLLAVLLVAKAVWLDRVDNPLVVWVRDGRVSGYSPPPNGSFAGQLQLIGSHQTGPDSVAFLWQAGQDNLPRYQIDLTLVDVLGRPLLAVHNDAPGFSVTSNWEAGQLIRDEISLPLASLPEPWGGTLLLSVTAAETGSTLPLENETGQTAVTLTRLQKGPAETAVPETIGTHFGSGIKLRHADLPARLSADSPLAFTLYWESLAPVAEDYTVFVHLLKPEGTLAAGQDGQPLDGRYPTSFWAAGEIVADGREWQPNLPPGTYQLQVGLYRLESGERLPVTGPGSELGDRIILQEITITP